MNDHSSPTPINLPATVTRYTDAIDAVLAKGHAALARHDRLLRERDTRFGSNAAVLFDPEKLPLAQRHIQRRLQHLTENLYRTFFGPVPKTPPARILSAARALGSRNRI